MENVFFEAHIFPAGLEPLCERIQHRYPYYKGAILHVLFVYITETLYYSIAQKKPKQGVELKVFVAH